MSPGRPSSQLRRAYTLLELLAVLTVIAILAGIVLGVGRRAAEAGKTARARVELAAVSAALETYKRTYGDYPRTGDPARLLQSLIGKKGPANAAISGPNLLESARFTFANSGDPFTDPAVVLVDPWARPYVYAYLSTTPWNNPGFVLYSTGPDGNDSPTLLAGGFPDVAPSANTDNIHANR